MFAAHHQCSSNDALPENGETCKKAEVAVQAAESWRHQPAKIARKAEWKSIVEGRRPTG